MVRAWLLALGVAHLLGFSAALGVAAPPGAGDRPGRPGPDAPFADPASGRLPAHLLKQPVQRPVLDPQLPRPARRHKTYRGLLAAYIRMLTIPWSARYRYNTMTGVGFHRLTAFGTASQTRRYTPAGVYW